MAAKRVPLEDGLIEVRGGERPLWLWVQTCLEPECMCRTVLLASSWQGKDALWATVQRIDEATESGAQPDQIQEQFKDEHVCWIDLDSARALNLSEPSRVFPTGVPKAISEVISRLDGETLDEIDRKWHRGKGRAEPELTPRGPSQIRDWKLGRHLGWEDVYQDCRVDIYAFGRELYIAQEHYCVVPGCSCGEHSLVFVRMAERRPEEIGAIRFVAQADEQLKPNRGHKQLLTLLWDAYKKRNPNYRERIARRKSLMEAWGQQHEAELLRGPAAQARKPEPNEPCPCGSGKKYKKCCWKQDLAGKAQAVSSGGESLLSQGPQGKD